MPLVDTDDLIDAVEVAEIIGLSSAKAVSTYQARYPDMPRPIVEKRRGRLWSKAAMTTWAAQRRR